MMGNSTHQHIHCFLWMLLGETSVSLSLQLQSFEAGVQYPLDENLVESTSNVGCAPKRCLAKQAGRARSQSSCKAKQLPWNIAELMY